MAVIIDNILIHGKSQAEHDQRLTKVVETVKASGLCFNHEKCRLWESELAYFDQLVGKDGLKTHPEKVNAITKLQPLSNISKLRTVLGMFNYLENFLPNLATL